MDELAAIVGSQKLRSTPPLDHFPEQPEGKILCERWIAGGTNGLTLNSPKGMTVVGNTLYVADNAAVLLFDRKTGRHLRTINVPGAEFLNLNLLMLAVLQPSTNTALPLGWTQLDHGGNSSTRAQVELLEACLRSCR